MGSSTVLTTSVLVFAVVTSSCGGTRSVRDAAPTDAATESVNAGDGPKGDATSADVSSADVSSVDASTADVSTTDVSASDVGAADAGRTCVDAGGVDAGDACLGTLALFNTGVGPSGMALAGGSIDPHYKLILSADSTFTGPDAIVVDQIAEGYWVAQSATGKWIAPSPNQSYPGATPCNAAGTYAYRTTFDLTGFNPATAKITGQWGADNSGTAVRLNGMSLGITAASYAPLTSFTIETGFVAGTNTLEFEILDLGCPNGLRVELSGVAAFGS
jgi:hypothetical protein